MIFAIGDAIERSIGLPVAEDGKHFATVEEPLQEDVPRYMVRDTSKGEPMWGVFVAGWARKASDGLVGKARADAVQGCGEVLAFLNGEFDEQPSSVATPTENLFEILKTNDVDFVSYDDVLKIIERESEIAAERGLPEFKFDRAADMMSLIR